MGIFDISSGNVDFGITCPGTVMRDLQRDEPEQVAKIKTLQTSYSSTQKAYQCDLWSTDLRPVNSFIKAIDGLEELTIYNYERDVPALWEAIFHHGHSLRSLAIHTPTCSSMPAGLWTHDAVRAVADRLPLLKHLELDASPAEAEFYLASTSSNIWRRLSSVQAHLSPKPLLSSTKKDASPVADIPAPPPKDKEEQASSAANEQKDWVLDAATKLHGLESIRINVSLEDTASPFAGEHKWTIMGSSVFPEPNKQACKDLARKIFDPFSQSQPSDATQPEQTPAAALTHLELRFPRRLFDDRCQFWNMAYSVHVRRSPDTGAVEVLADEGWKTYMPDTPPPLYDMRIKMLNGW
ncbi:hypothetical protein B0T24DRAFT_627373 [Lasiosphaeria ovina]|uniref:Uncharacterized protein n=1 Tax=Lasiosphaeria ovina TaxID=92902 RepID=A0AAE0K764_9PEZI|nr:hypothetical protein B0T24DRAFT_627373 [Lasiosphaeria ovina]